MKLNCYQIYTNKRQFNLHPLPPHFLFFFFKPCIGRASCCPKHFSMKINLVNHLYLYQSHIVNINTDKYSCKLGVHICNSARISSDNFSL